MYHQPGRALWLVMKRLDPYGVNLTSGRPVRNTEPTPCVRELSMTTMEPRPAAVPHAYVDLTDPVDEVAALVRAAASGDQRAWDGLVERYHRLVWAVVRTYRLSPADAADVTQITWLKLVEHLGTLRDPARVGAWLATTARREALHLARQRRADLDRIADVDLVVLASDAPSLDDALLRGESDAALFRAVRELDERCQVLLRALAVSPPPRYDEISQALGMPIGSIGPTRGRCLERLRQTLTAQGWANDDDAMREVPL